MKEHTVIWDDATEQAYINLPITAAIISDSADHIDVPTLQPVPIVFTWTTTTIETETIIDYDIRCQKVWGIDHQLNLCEAAADFYLLYDLWLDGLDEGQFEVWLSVLVIQFSDYIDMIVGGELRHLSHKHRPTAVIPEELASLIFLHPQFRSQKREQAWYAWHGFRQEHGLEALKWAVVGFHCFIASSFGGPKWATITTTLLAFLRGDLTPIAFVDFCWGLQHNGGTFFNKVWNSDDRLQRILEANLQGDVTWLQQSASLAVKELYATKRRPDVTNDA